MSKSTLPHKLEAEIKKIIRNIKDKLSKLTSSNKLEAEGGEEAEVRDLIKKIEEASLKNHQLKRELKAKEGVNKSIQYKLKAKGYNFVTHDNQETVNPKFYDSVINIPNLKSLRQGWDIDIKDWKEYQPLTKKDGTIVAVVGNSGKGKTFLLELLSEHVTSHGFNINTKGISMVYLRDQDNKDALPIIGLDTKGGSIPIDVSGIKSEAADAWWNKPDNLNQSTENQEATLKEILKDHEAIEDIVQNFIIEQANIIIVVIADLTFSEQKLIEEIKKKFKSDSKKKIIVVHNLYHTHYLIDMDHKIQDYILKSFALEEHTYRKDIPDKNRQYFVEMSEKIPHIILAKEDTQAGDYYNKVGIQYLKEYIDTNDSYKSVDIVQEFHKFLQKYLHCYIKANTKFKEQDLVLHKDDNGKPLRLSIENQEKIKIKTIFADELGYRLMHTGDFQPSFVTYEETASEDKKYFCLKIECPGSSVSLKTKVYQTSADFRIEVKGTKKPHPLKSEELIVDTRSFGNFVILTEAYETSRYHFDYLHKPKPICENGTVIFKWELLPQKEDDDGWINN